MARPISPQCLCGELPETAVIDMGDESLEVFQNLEEIRRRGMPYWWLSAYKCQACGQGWLVAQEERQNDVFCLRKLTPKVLDRICRHQDWPEDFDHYETLLRLGADAGKRVHFLDPLNSSLVRTTADLAREHPGIRVSELADLLNLDPELAIALAQKVIEEQVVRIEFDIG